MGYWRFVCLGIVDVGGWLVVGCLMLIGGLSEANGHDIQYPPAHQTAGTRATQTQHYLMCRSCVRCLVFGGWSVVSWLVGCCLLLGIAPMCSFVRLICEGKLQMFNDI